VSGKYIVKKKSIAYPQDGFISAHLGYLNLEQAQQLQENINKTKLFSTMIVEVS